jgi:hypothetical protein
MARTGFGAGFSGKRYEFADPDPYQNVTDPEHWLGKMDIKYFPINKPMPAEKKTLFV